MTGGKKIKNNSPFLDRFYEELEKARRCSPHTLRAYRQNLSAFSDHLTSRGKSLETADYRDMRDFIYSLHRQGNSPRTVARKLAAIKSLYRFLQRIGIVPTNPADLITPPREKRKLPDLVPLSTISKALDDSNPDSPFELRDCAMLELFFGTGIRLSELAGLTLGTVRETFIRVRGKGDKTREIPLTKHAAEALKKYIKYRSYFLKEKKDNGYIFLSRSGRPLTTRDIARRVKLCLNRTDASSPDHPHALRHSYATEMLAGGADIRVIKELLGHSSLNTTQQYVHVGIERLRDIVKQAHPHAEKELE